MLLKVSQRVHPSPDSLYTTITPPPLSCGLDFNSTNASLGPEMQQKGEPPLHSVTRISLGKNRDQEKSRQAWV